MNKIIATCFSTAAVVLLTLTSAHAFTHPGIPLTTADLDQIKAHLNIEPWKSGFAALAADSRSSLSYSIQGPFAEVSRGTSSTGVTNMNLAAWRNDMTAIFNLSCMFYLSGSSAYAQKAHDILLSYANTQTSFTGNEAPLDLGDYAFCYAGGADILRATWSGWTSSDTTAVQALFGNIYWPATSVGSNILGPANKGALALEAGAAIAVFNDDQTKLNQVINHFLTNSACTLRNTLPNGQTGESGRDQGHSYGDWEGLAFVAEVLWKQGVDVYSQSDNRLLATGEFFARNNLLVDTTYIPFGTIDAYYTTNSAVGWIAGRMGMNLLQGAYVLRKGLDAPYLALLRAWVPEDSHSFLFNKSMDPSTATAPSTVSFPSTASVTSGLTDVDIGTATPTGSCTYSSGTWTVSGGGAEIWGSGSDSCTFAYKTVSGSCAMIAKVESVQNTSIGAKAGVMLRTSLLSTATNAWIAITPSNTFEYTMTGWSNMWGGSNYEKASRTISQSSYWVKLERADPMITCYVSPDGVSWAAACRAEFSNLPTTLYWGLVVCSLSNGTSNTSTFSNVQITGGSGSASVTIPKAPLAVNASPGNSCVPLRWAEAFGATSYTIKRSTVSGGSYTTIATVSGSNSYIDTTVSNETTYYYVVCASNSAGTSGNSPEDAVIPTTALVNVATSGSATAMVGGGGTEGPEKAFDRGTGTKWFTGSGYSTAWLQYDFGSNVTQTIKAYAISSANDVPARDPSAWLFQASTDGSTWKTLDTQTGQVFDNRYETLYYGLANTTAYRYYRLNVTAASGTDSIQLSELALLTNEGHTVASGTYCLFNRKCNKVLDVYASGTSCGALVDQNSYSGSNTQKWILTDIGSGQYQIKNLASGYVLDVVGNNTKSGTSLDIWSWNSGNNQKWKIIPTGSGYYKLQSVLSGMVVDVYGGSTADGTTLIQYPYQMGSNQQWSISIAP